MIAFKRWPGARSMMLRLPLPCSPVVFLSIDYERYMTLLLRRQGIGSRIVGEMLRGGGGEHM
jgi:hypothetical protein